MSGVGRRKRTGYPQPSISVDDPKQSFRAEPGRCRSGIFRLFLLFLLSRRGGPKVRRTGVKFRTTRTRTQIALMKETNTVIRAHRSMRRAKRDEPAKGPFQEGRGIAEMHAVRAKSMWVFADHQPSGKRAREHST
jgi:hypothetical protein